MIAHQKRHVVLICACHGKQDFRRIDFVELADRLRLLLADRVETVAIHPRLCEPDGERLLRKLVAPSVSVVTVGCCSFQQSKMLRGGLAGNERDWIRVDVTGHDIDSAFAEIEAALQAPDEEVCAGLHAAAD